MKKAYKEEFARIVRTPEDVEKYTDEELYDLLRLLDGQPEPESQSKRELTLIKIAKQKRLILKKARIKRVKTNGSTILPLQATNQNSVLESSDSEEEAVDEQREDLFSPSKSKKKKQKTINNGMNDVPIEEDEEQSVQTKQLDREVDDVKSKVSNQTTTPKKKKQNQLNKNTHAAVENTDICEPLVERKKDFVREQKIKHKFLPLLLSTTSSKTSLPKQPRTGKLGLIVSNDWAPAFRDIPLLRGGSSSTTGTTTLAPGTTTTASSIHDVLVYASNRRIHAVPIVRKPFQFAVDSSIVSKEPVDSPIFQLAQLHHPSGAWFATRGETQLDLFGMNRTEWEWEHRATSEQFQLESSPLVHIDPSPFEPGRIAMLDESSLMVWDVEDALVPQKICSALPGQRFRRCGFGTHPSIIYLCSKSQFLLTDGRKPKRGLVDLFKHYPDSRSKLDADFLTFSRVYNKRDEYVLITRSSALLLDVRFPGRFICREPHLVPFAHHEHCHTEIVFSRTDPMSFVYSTSANPCYGLLGPFPPTQMMHPEIHQERVELGMPLSDYHPTGFRLLNPLSNYDEVRGRVDSTYFRFKRLDKVFHSLDFINRLDVATQEETRSINRRRGNPYLSNGRRDDEFMFQGIIGAGFLSPKKRKRVAKNNRNTLLVVGTAFAHESTTTTRSGGERVLGGDPHLVCRGIDW